MGGRAVGGLVGLNTGNVAHCQGAGDVYGEYAVGGLVGESSHGVISSSWASGNVTGIYEASSEGVLAIGRCLGGLVGDSRDDAVSDCSASGRVRGEIQVGGLVGQSSRSSIERCHATGPVSAGYQGAGGLVGSAGFGTVVSECYACALVSARWEGGGLVSLNGGTIQSSWAAGEVSGTSGIGGLVGELWQWSMIVLDTGVEYAGVITDCYAMADVVCGGARGGGLVGSNQGGTVLRCFAAGTVVGFQDVGGLVGTDSEAHPSIVERSFWDIDASGLGLSARGTGLSTSQMQDRATYIDAGWDFTDESINGPNDIWYMDANVAMYPRLTWDTAPIVCAPQPRRN